MSVNAPDGTAWAGGDYITSRTALVYSNVNKSLNFSKIDNLKNQSRLELDIYMFYQIFQGLHLFLLFLKITLLLK